MRNLLDLLGRFSKSLNRDAFTKEAISNIIFEYTKVRLTPEQIMLKNGVLEITTGATAKNEILLKEEIIKQVLKESQQVSVSRVLYKS